MKTIRRTCLLAVSIALMGAGCFSTPAAPGTPAPAAPTPSQPSKPAPSKPASQASNVFDPLTVKAGDKIADMIVVAVTGQTSVSTVVVRFSGQATVSGTFSCGASKTDSAVSFSLDAASASALPESSVSLNPPDESLHFSNQSDAKAALCGSALSGHAIVVISDYAVRTGSNSATLVRVE